MKRSLLKLRSRQLVLRTRYRSRRPIIPLGCWCHPAEVLKSLGIRRASFPFDWLATHPAKGIAYVNSNIETKFQNFIRELTTNDAGHLVSQHYPYAEFIHYSDLASNTDRRQQMMRRSMRFLECFDNESCTFLYSLTQVGLGTQAEVNGFLDSVKTFHRLGGGRHQLAIYITYEESITENSTRCGDVHSRLLETENTSVVKYVRHVAQHGIWGDPDGYLTLLKSFGIRVVPALPLVRWESIDQPSSEA